MSGPPPKMYGRARRNAPARGDWLALPAVEHEVPELPAGDWCEPVVTAWASWWRDPASGTWGSAQRNAVEELLVLTQEFWLGNHRVAKEMRARSDALGLTERGKRSLRWRVPLESRDR